MLKRFLPDGGTQTLTVVTDCEPDDLLALALLFTHVTPTRMITVVVSGWTDRATKATLLWMFLTRRFPAFTSCVGIVLGEPSAETHDLAAVLRFPVRPEFSDYLTVYADVIVQLAPPRELVRMYLHTPTAFSRSALFIYGSWNVRSMIPGEMSTATCRAMLESFAFTFYYESFHVVAPTAMHSPELVVALGRRWPEILALVMWWNQTIRAASPVDDAICASIDAFPLQMLDGDCGLVLTALEHDITAAGVYSGTFGLRDGYAEITPVRTHVDAPARPTYTYHAVDKTRMHEAHLAAYLRILAK